MSPPGLHFLEEPPRKSLLSRVPPPACVCVFCFRLTLTRSQLRHQRSSVWDGTHRMLSEFESGLCPVCIKLCTTSTTMKCCHRSVFVLSPLVDSFPLSEKKQNAQPFLEFPSLGCTFQGRLSMACTYTTVSIPAECPPTHRCRRTLHRYFSPLCPPPLHRVNAVPSSAI